MRETPGYFDGPGGSPLYGVYHAPEPAARAPVLIAPGLFEERKSAYAALTVLARALAAVGHPVLRFDYRGSGESGGAAAARRWKDLGADLAAARAALGRLSGRPDAALLGLRLGATLALQEAPRLDAQAVVAIAPVLKGAAEVRLWRLRSKVRAELTAGAAPALNQGAAAAAAATRLDLDGFAVSAEFLNDVASLELLTAAPELPCPGLVVQASYRPTAAPESEALVAALGPRARLACVRVEPFWDRVDDVDIQAVQERVVSFLGECEHG